MSHMGNMTARLKPLGLYSLESSTVVYKELLCYAQQLEAVADEISNLLKESIVTSAEDYGIEMWELLWGVKRSDMDIAKRRQAISERLALTGRSCTVDDVKNFFLSLGAKAEISEDYIKNRLYIHITNGSEISMNLRKYISAQALEFLPAHLAVFLDYRLGNWNTLDQKNNTFNTYDAMNYTWDKLEHYE
ncbi:putative phage tail protein [Oscillospiraceae bacterium LCP25S3_E10]|nr:hypothetical protein [Ruminococcus sp.]MDD6447850.1 hypothetical protein [Ruminococcus sp.]MDY2855588.1 hypothetical protein [Oscillospiraceae bacterium]